MAAVLQLLLLDASAVWGVPEAFGAFVAEFLPVWRKSLKDATGEFLYASFASGIVSLELVGSASV